MLCIASIRATHSGGRLGNDGVKTGMADVSVGGITVNMCSVSLGDWRNGMSANIGDSSKHRASNRYDGNGAQQNSLLCLEDVFVNLADAPGVSMRNIGGVSRR